MTTYANLTAAQKTAVLEFVPVLREAAVQYGRLLGRFAAIKKQYGLDCFAILNSLDGGEIVPDPERSAYRGSVALAKDDIMALAGDFSALFDADDAGHSDRRAKAAGAINTVG